MRRILLSAAALILALSIGGTSADARGPRGGGFGYGCGNCSGPSGADDQFRKFQAETIDLRQEMMLKRFEIQRENLKGTPDSAKLEQLKKEISEIQSKIKAVRAQNGLPESGGKRDGECGPAGCGQGRGGCGPCGQRF